MLTCSKPITLTCRRNMSSLSDSFGERMRANYAIFPAQFAPRDLLHLLAGSQEMPPVGGGMTSIAVDTRIENRQNILLDVVNNVVNRVLLEDRSELTYQDRVYIETALNKMGIENISQFVAQIREMKSESTSIHRLLSLYQDNFTFLSATLRQAAEKRPAASLAARDSQERESGSAPELYIHNEIFKRLQSAEIYNLFFRHMRGAADSVHTIDRRELEVAEQLRTASSLTLNEYKSRVLQTQNLALAHYTNRYELGDLLPPPQSEGEVVTQASASALLSVIGNVLQTRIQNFLSKQDLWLDMRTAVSKSAENSLLRFISYHSEGGPSFAENRIDARQIAALYTAEAGILSRFVAQINQTSSQISHVAQTHREGDLRLTHIETTERDESRSDIHSQTVREGDTLSGTEIQNITQQVLNMQQTGAAPPSGRAAPPAAQSERELRAGAPPESRDALYGAASPQFVLQALTNITRAQSLIMPRERAARVPAELAERYFHAVLESVQPSEFPPAAAQHRTDITEQTTVRQTISGGQQTDITHVHTHRAAQGEPPAAGDESETRILEEVTLRSALDEINRQNRERYERVLEHRIERHEQQPLPAPDRKRILRDALRAIESPEKVLADALERAPQEHPAYPPEAQAALAETDEATRRIYEAVMEYHRNPEAAAAAGIVRAVEPSALNAEAESVIRERAELEHIIESQTTERQSASMETETVLERMIERTAARPSAARGASGWSGAPVQIVHKQAESRISEEMLSLLERQHTEQVEETERRETTRETTTHETITTRQIQEITAKTTEDVTELINRTLARQIGAISDRVYSQLERKLQTERARRGRY